MTHCSGVRERWVWTPEEMSGCGGVRLGSGKVDLDSRRDFRVWWGKTGLRKGGSKLWKGARVRRG